MTATRLVIGGAVLYVATVAVAGVLTPGYDSARQLISELGQVGAPHAPALRAMLVAVGVSVLVLAAALHRSLRASGKGIGTAMLAAVGIGLFLGGVFQCDELCAPRTFAGWMHLVTGIPAMLVALVGPFVFARLFARDPAFARFARASRVFGWVALTGELSALLVFTPLGVPGAGQRIATAVPLMWIAFLAVALERAARPARPAFPPGPSGLRALRYLGWKRDLLDFTARCLRDYGGLVGLRLPGVRACLISDPALMDEVLIKNASRIKKWDAGQFELLLGKGLLTSEGELWRRQRSLIQPVFSPARMAAHTQRILADTEGMLAAWPKQGIIDVQDELLKITLRIASGVLFGTDSKGFEEIMLETHDQLLLQFEQSMQGFPLPMWVPTPLNLRTKRAIRRMDAAVRELIAQRKRRPDGGSGDDFLGALLAARDESGQGMSDEQLRDECVTMILAGHETTAVALTWTLYLVAQHPELEVEPKRAIEEAMRLYPPSWAMGRVATQPLTIGGYEIPAGTQLFLLPFYAHRDGASFADPMKFSPERWSASPKPARCAYVPFGAGARKCVGMHFAVNEMTVMLELLLRRFRFSPTDQVVKLQPSVTLRPRDGLRLVVEAR